MRFTVGPMAGSQSGNATLRHRDDLQGLRAVAVLLVVLGHAGVHFLRGGYVGVDVFFVISGFLITGIIADGLERQKFSFAHFYARRVRRLFPALTVVLAACWAIGWFELLPPELVQLGRHVIGGAGFVANLVFWSEAWYFDTLAAAKPLLHLWSLGVEEQFYLFWPLTLVILSRRNEPLGSGALRGPTPERCAAVLCSVRRLFRPAGEKQPW